MKVLFVFLYIIIFSFFHAKDIAEYSYKLNDDYLRMKFTIEKAEVNNFNFNSDCNINQMTALCLTKYINEKSYIKINGKAVKLKLNDSYTDKDHLVINLSAKITSPNSIKELIVYNSCFYEFNSKFKNRIILDIARFQKSYLLTKKKDKIILN